MSLIRQANMPRFSNNRLSALLSRILQASHGYDDAIATLGLPTYLI